MKKMKAAFVVALALFVFSACKKDDTKVKPANPKPKADLYYSAKIDGADFLLEALKDNYGSGAGASGGSAGGEWSEEQSLALVNLTTPNGSGVVFVKTFPQKPDKCVQIEAMIYPGVFPYGITSKGSEDKAENGVVVFHTDANGKYWASDLGIGDQTGSKFEVVEHIANNDGFSQRITKARFNCKLYDGQGNSKTLTNGEIRSRSVQCNFL